MTNRQYENGLHFGCTQCHICCRGEPGYVMLSMKDIHKMADFLSMSVRSFAEKYCRPVRRQAETYVSLIEKSNYDCVFWDQGCTIYDSRPLQCSSYPFWKSILDQDDGWENEKSYCPGIGKGKLFSVKEIDEILDKRSDEPYAQWKDVLPRDEES
ncbi:YkgJ family cysteine cluster protein [Spirochaeta dissipatitropha]